MLIMGLYPQYINRTTSDFTSFFTSLQQKKDNFEGSIGSKIYKHYIIRKFFALINIQRLIQLLIIITWKFVRIQIIITNENYGNKT
jgi:hypothetical protein